MTCDEDEVLAGTVFTDVVTLAGVAGFDGANGVDFVVHLLF